MSYSENLKKRYKFERKANKIMSIYIKIADDLYRKHAGKYAGLRHMNFEESGIEYEYYRDNWDYSAGISTYFVNKDKLDSLVEEYKRKERLEKLKKLEEK